jgi:hypothetical protein
MGIYIKWCECGGSILTTEQMETDGLCDRCRKEQIKEKEKIAKKDDWQ